MFPKGSPSLSDCHPKHKIASPGARTTASVIHSFRPSWNISAITKPLHSWESGVCSPPQSPRVTLTWMQYHVQPSYSGWSCQHSGDTDHLDGNRLDCMNLKDILNGVPIFDSPSSNKATSLRTWTTSPASPPWGNGVGEAPFWASAPPLAAFLCFPMWRQESYSRVI